MMKQQKRPCADVCTDCDVKGNNITKCRQHLQHDDDNAICKKKVDCCEKLGLPQYCLNLSNIHLECYVSNPEKLKAQDTIGYMIPYSHDNWEKWFQLFVLQPQCEYTIQNGCKTNDQSQEKGVIRVNKDKFTYTLSWVHTYSCLRGGEGKFNPLSLKKKLRISIGTRRLGCQACIHLRLLRISNGMKILEIKVPLLSAHLPVHNPLSISDQLTIKPLPEVEQKVAELIQECFINQRALKMLLTSWVDKELIPNH